MPVAAPFSGAGASVLAAPCPFADVLTYRGFGPGFSCTVNDKTISGITTTGLSGPNILLGPVTAAGSPGLTLVSLLAGPTISGTLSYTITTPSTDPMNV